MIRLLSWFEQNARDLPWRQPGTTPWEVLVSEVMLQQTPVARVIPVWNDWIARWPTPGALADADSAEVLNAWGRLGYPRRALRLREAATRIHIEYDGIVPAELAQLRALPGIGEYTAAAIRSLAFRQSAVVLDVNIRRVLTRVYLGTDLEASSITNEERALAAAALDETGQDPAWNAAIMEFGALVCTARVPKCSVCPIQDLCGWRKAGYPEPSRKRRGQAWEGTDRQVRGKMVEHLRRSSHFVSPTFELMALWDDREQAERALQALCDDGLIHRRGKNEYALGTAPAEDGPRQ